jgi:hypothetical protein
LTPVNNDTFSLQSSISVSAVAADPDGTVERIEYYLMGKKIGESLTPPYSIVFECDSAGVYEITAKVFDNLNASATSEPVIFRINPLEPNPDLITLYPNPNHGAFQIEMTTPADNPGFYDISVVSLSGRTVYYYLASSGEVNRTIDISDSPGGNYILFVSSGGRVLSSRQFVKL